MRHFILNAQFIIFFCFIGTISGSDLLPYTHVVLRDGTLLTGKGPKIVSQAPTINGPWTKFFQNHNSLNNRTAYTANAVRYPAKSTITFYHIKWLDQITLGTILDSTRETQLFGLGTPSFSSIEPWQFESTGAQGNFEGESIQGALVIRLKFDPFHKRYNGEITHGTYVTSLWIQMSDKHIPEIEYPWLLIQITANREGLITKILYSKESSQQAIPVELRKDFYDGTKALNQLELDFTEWAEKLKN